jgi:hypothetical protein
VLVGLMPGSAVPHLTVMLAPRPKRFRMAPLGALSQSWVTAEASLPLGWQVSGLLRFDDLSIALARGSALDDDLSRVSTRRGPYGRLLWPGGEGFAASREG